MKRLAHIPPMLALGLLLAGPALAVSDPQEMLPDPQQEARAVEVGSQALMRSAVAPSSTPMKYGAPGRSAGASA